jgi:hypothetical protein
MAARSSPPPPPPGNTNPPPPPPGGNDSAPSAQPARARRDAHTYRVDRPSAPPSAELGEATLVASLDRPTAVDAARALARTDDLEAVLTAPAEVAAAPNPMRVEAATADDGGLVETVLGSLLGFFL